MELTNASTAYNSLSEAEEVIFSVAPSDLEKDQTNCLEQPEKHNQQWVEENLNVQSEEREIESPFQEALFEPLEESTDHQTECKQQRTEDVSQCRIQISAEIGENRTMLVTARLGPFLSGLVWHGRNR